MHFDKRDIDREQRIAQRDAGVRERTGIDDDERHAIGFRFLHPVDQFVFGIALAAGNVVAQVGGDRRATRLDIGKRRCAVNIGLT